MFDMTETNQAWKVIIYPILHHFLPSYRRQTHREVSFWDRKA